MSLWKLCLLTVTLLSTAWVFGAGQKKDFDPGSLNLPKTVYEYYRLLPDSIFSPWETPDRDKAIAVKDLRNGYLKVTGAWEGFGEVAVFRLTDPRRRLVVAAKASCGPVCTQDIFCLEYFDGSWIDRTKRVWPEIPKARIVEQYRKLKHPADPNDWGDDVPILFLLPRIGTTIRVVVQPQFTRSEITLFELRFDRTQFAVFPK